MIGNYFTFSALQFSSVNKSAPTLLLIPALLAIKLPWMLLQIFAWCYMIEENHHTTGTLLEAVQLTFSPENRCGICKSIDITQEQTSETQSPTLGNDIVILLPVFSQFQLSTDFPHFPLPEHSSLDAQWISDATKPPPKVA